MANDERPDEGWWSADRPYENPLEFPPMSSRVRATFGAQSRRGTLRRVNSDHYLIIKLTRAEETIMTSLPAGVIADRFDEYGYGMVVADGLDDDDSVGETASRLALATLMHLVLHFGKWNLRIDHGIADEVKQRAERFYRHVDTTLVREALSGGTANRLQTTLTATYGAGRDMFFAHVGHSRAYLLREGQLMRLTHDHTIGRNNRSSAPVAPLVDVNTAARDLKHILTDTIGMRGSVGPRIDLERFLLYDGDVVLVCTNGLTDMVDEEQIKKVLGSNQTPDEQCRALVELAFAAGGDDDVTALISRYEIPQ